MNIPKIIHQTWKDNNIPNHWKESPVSWKKHHPDWQYILWTDENNRNFIKTEFPWFLSYYDTYEYNIQRVDAVRYFILYKYGGMYVDCDIACIKNIEPLLPRDKDFDVLLVETKNNIIKTYTNSIMFSKKGAVFWLKVFDRLVYEHSKHWYHIGTHLSVMYSTGPSMLTNVYHENPLNVGMLLYEYLHPCSICDEKPCIKNTAYVKILTGSSWVALDGKILTCVYCNKYKIIVFIVFIVFIIWLFYNWYKHT